MLATDVLSDEENEDAERSSSQRPRSISGDDLGDSFILDEETRTKRGWVDEILERRDTEDNESGEDDFSEDKSAEDGSNEEESDEDNDEEDLSMKDWEQSDDDNLETDLGGEEEDIEENDEDDTADENNLGQKESKKSQNIDAVESSKRLENSSDFKKINADGKLTLARLELPYLIEAPKSLEELYAVLDNCSNTDVVLIINRIRASNAIKLAAENRKKMQVWDVNRFCNIFEFTGRRVG